MRQIAEEVVEERMYSTAKRAAEDTIHEAFDRLGIEYSNPLVQQKRAQTLATITRWLDRGGITAVTTIIAVFVSGGLALVWAAITKSSG